MRNVLFFGKSDRRIEDWAKAHARVIESDGGGVIFIAPYGENYTEGNFTFVNCFTVASVKTIEELQNCLPVSINRTLACDRSLTDYTWSIPYYSYAKWAPLEVERLIEKMGNAIWKYMQDADYCIDGLFDNFVTPLAFQIAEQCNVKFYSIRLWQYWDAQFHVVDAPGNASTLVDECYRRYYPRLNASMYPSIRDEFMRARFRPGAFRRENWRFRLKIVQDKFGSYERVSLRYFLLRRINRMMGSLRARGLRFAAQAVRPERYIVFALHVAPEASILGTDPDIADQFSLIRRMSLNVPFGVRILCKAHPGDRFGRDIEIGFLRRLCSLHNVSLVPESESIDSFLNDKRCLAIATINGSVAFDAVLKDKPCFVFGQGIFSIANCFLKPESDDEFFEQVRTIVEGRYAIDRVALASIILGLKRTAISGSASLKDPGPWLSFYSSLLPAIHKWHMNRIDRTARR